MLNESEIERAASQLADYRRNDALADILEQYSALIQDYRRLKSDYEEERDAREKYKQMARGQERNPFVLVLVDGDGYVLNDHFITKGADGGSNASNSLNEAVKNSLRKKGLEHCQVMIRIYANVVGLSKALHKAGGLAGAEKRSIAPFIAGFNRSHGLGDFVDAGELKENADFKLRAMLHLYAENAQCKHIYFAACHDAGYISDLTPHTGNSTRFTLVNTPSINFHPEFRKLGMGVEDFSGVFRREPLELASGRSSVFSPVKPLTGLVQKPSQLDPAEYSPLPTGVDSQRPVCSFYPLGKCRFGNDCKNLHSKGRGSTNPTWRSASNDPQSVPNEPLKDRLNRPTSFSGADSNADFIGRSGALEPPGLDKLPRKEDIPEGFVAINKNRFRLDPYSSLCSTEAVEALKMRGRLCNNFQLNGFCPNGNGCSYSHEPLNADTKAVLEGLARSAPCPRRGDCRNSACTMGHICQKVDCKHRGGKVFCKMPYLSHTEDFAVASLIAAINKSHHIRQPTSVNGSIIIKDEEIIRLSPSLSDEGEDKLSSGGSDGALIDSHPYAPDC